MQALGLIETKGLLAAIEAADTMVKSADVSIIEKTYVGGGLVTVLITGDVGAVKASIEAGVAAVKKLDEGFLVSQHVIPRPHEELKDIIGPNNPEDYPTPNEENSEKNQEALDSDKTFKVNIENLRKDDIDKLVREDGIEKTISILSKLKVVKLRNLAREYKDFVITGRAISKADKNLLINKFRLYYEKE